MADVSTPCAEYRGAAETWQLIEDAAEGEAAIKAGGEKYLPKLNPADTSLANKARNADYLKRAVYYNATGRTLDSFLGLAFRKDPEIKVPTALEDLLADIDGTGASLIQQAHDTTGEVIKVGRAGLLSDFPKTDKPTSRADEQKGGIRPTLSFYPATSIINWRVSKQGAKIKLSLVVLRETHKEFNGFETKTETQYRALSLIDGKYHVDIWRQRLNLQTSTMQWQVVEFADPVDGNSNPLDFIPFTFVGSKNNTSGVNKAPLADLAAVNVAHYRNSADHEDSAFTVGQPQVWIAGLDTEWRDHLEKSGVYIGSRSVLPLPVGGSAGIMQAQPNTLVKEAMKTKETQMAALGARLIQTDSTIKTATQQDSEDGTANSVLSLCCDNVSAAYSLALSWCALFAGITGNCSVAIPTDFTKYSITGEELTSLMGAVQAGLVPKSDFWSRMRLAGVIAADKTDDDIREEIEQDPPPGLLQSDDPGADPEEDPEDGKTKPPAE
jgi:hypothetical protein